MFDIGFSELLLIAVVALVVIGPERLPKVARTAGLLFGRFQRYVGGLRADIQRELQLEEIQRSAEALRQQMQHTAEEVRTDLENSAADARDALQEAERQAAIQPLPAQQAAARPDAGPSVAGQPAVSAKDAEPQTLAEAVAAAVRASALQEELPPPAPIIEDAHTRQAELSFEPPSAQTSK